MIRKTLSKLVDRCLFVDGRMLNARQLVEEKAFIDAVNKLKRLSDALGLILRSSEIR